MNFREDINGLRAIAVLFVLLFHFGAPGFGAGFIGVDIFFVISGFLMTRIIVSGLEAGSFSILGFYRARLVRLYPALLAVVVATLAFALVFVEPNALEGIARDGISALLFVSNIVFWKQAGYFGAPASTMWMLHTWSLSVEWQFYLIYPIVLALVFRFVPSRGGRFAVLLAGFLLSLVCSAALGMFFPNDRLVSAGFYMLPPRAWEMLAGGLILLWPARIAQHSAGAARILEITGIAAVFSGLLLFSKDTPWPSCAALLPVTGTMLVLIARTPRSILAFAPLQWIGTWSYSVYLWHWPIVAAVAYFEASSSMVAATAFILSLVAGWLSYRWIEQPCRAWLSRPNGAAPKLGRPMAALGAVAFAVIAAAAVVMVDHGIPQRANVAAAAYQETLAAAADTKFPRGCDGTTIFGTALRQCELGKASDHSDVLVMGDSFAQPWYSHVLMLDAELTDHAVVFVTKGGCPPIAGLDRKSPGFGCSSFHRLAMEQARSNRYHTIILAGMWTAYFTRSEPNSVICGKDGRCLSTGTDPGLSAALGSMADEIDGLRALGKTVVVLTTSPYPNFDVPVGLRRRIFAGNPPAGDWPFNFGAIVAGSEPVDAGLQTFSKLGAKVVNLADLLCRNMICPAIREGAPLYRDAAHLRSNYTALVGGFLDPLIGVAQ
ncbi:acyltransferase family protein [Mesorhizobium sp. ES1-1]|uniref:acyltransferase family protein n=1 Tax=Mesorhizobium sp. ES1-1 TaxID=2876629 RepID=UPI001CCFB4A7|nr:acyltransferase family protein [Mesorhizobium sp. ES1-1]MBZ9674364.1 acyltransferase [Mesorhizobium sp. ES1-1]